MDPGWKHFGSGMNIPDPQEIDKGGVLSKGLVQEKVCTKRWAEIDKGVV